MKKLFAAMALALPVVVSAEFSLGVDFQTSLTNTRDVTEQPSGDETVRDTRYGLLVMPSLIIAPSSRLEIVPTIGFGLWKGKHEEEDVNGNVVDEWDYTSFGLGGGCGLFLRPVDGEVFRLSVGPDVLFWHDNPDGADNDSIGISLGLRVNTDLRITDRWFIRMSPRLVAIGYGNRQQGSDRHTGTVTIFDIATMWNPRLGFYFTF